MVEVVHRAAPDERLRDRFHCDSRHHPCLELSLLQHVLKGQRVDDCAEHPHVVGADPIHSHLRELGTTNDVAATDHETDGGTHLHNVGYFRRETFEDCKIKTGALLSGEGLAGELEQNPLVLELSQTWLYSSPI